MAGGGGGMPGGGPLNCYSNNTQGACNVGFVTGQIRTHAVTMLQESGNPGWTHGLALQPNGLQTGVVNFGTASRPADRNVIHYPNGRCSMTLLIDATWVRWRPR